MMELRESLVYEFVALMVYLNWRYTLEAIHRYCLYITEYQHLR